MEVHDTIVIFVLVLWSSREHVTFVTLSRISLSAIKFKKMCNLQWPILSIQKGDFNVLFIICIILEVFVEFI